MNFRCPWFLWFGMLAGMIAGVIVLESESEIAKNATALAIHIGDVTGIARIEKA